MIRNVFKYREADYADAIWRSGFQTYHITTELRLLVLYMRDMLGMKSSDRKTEVKKFCDAHIPGFDSIVDYKIIHKAQKSAQSNMRLVNVPAIDVYESDIRLLDGMKCSEEYRKVIFAILVFLRLEKQYREQKYEKPYNCLIFGGAKSFYSRIRKMSNAKSGITIYSDVIPWMIENGYAAAQYRGRVNMLFLDGYTPSGEVVMDVSDYDNIGLYYERYRGSRKISQCNECGSMFRRSSNNQRYCRLCSSAKSKQYYAEYMREYRKRKP